MSVQFKCYSIPSALAQDIQITEEDSAKISKRSTKTNRKLKKKMKVIDQKDKKSWQKSVIRNKNRFF